ncbi:unnamed protein product, partial [Ranitomeya imitator]
QQRGKDLKQERFIVWTSFCFNVKATPLGAKLQKNFGTSLHKPQELPTAPETPAKVSSVCKEQNAGSSSSQNFCKKIWGKGPKTGAREEQQKKLMDLQGEQQRRLVELRELQHEQGRKIKHIHLQ